MRFVKMHGAGNSYVYVDCIRYGKIDNPKEIAEIVSRPHFGIGSDGLILIEPSERADAMMRIFNADGSEGEMCGNGIRCVGKYLYDTGLVRRENISIDSLSGVKGLTLIIDDGVCTGARVDMGEPVLEGKKIPVSIDKTPVVGEVIEAAGERFAITCVSMGNPHAVLPVEKLPGDDFFVRAGKAIERHPLFPERTNVEFACVTKDKHIDVRVWERGSGATLACGTGACAALVACALNGLTGRVAEVRLPGGTLLIEWAEDNHVYMTGPAATVFTGEIDL